MGGGGWYYVPKVWSPSGGWWNYNPPNWKRNTGFAFGALAVSFVTLFYISAALERRPNPPYRKIPSQSWCKHAKEDDPRLR